LVSTVTHQETFAKGSKIRELHRLIEAYGGKNWRKCKGIGFIQFSDTNEIVQAELHWYEAHGIGKVEMKIKELL
jgi:hypothetical protein